MKNLFALLISVSALSGVSLAQTNVAPPSRVAGNAFTEIFDPGINDLAPYTQTTVLLENDGTYYQVAFFNESQLPPPFDSGTYVYRVNSDNTATLTFNSASGSSTIKTLHFNAAYNYGDPADGVMYAGSPPTDTRDFFRLEPIDAPWNFVNLSSRCLVGPSNPCTTGFVITGTIPRYVLVRAIGPALGQFGVTDFASAPSLQIVLQGGLLSQGNVPRRIVATNTGWGTTSGGVAALNSAFSRTGAFPLPANSADSAAVVLLNPGIYTAQVSSAQLGEVLMEVYVVP